MLYDPKWEQKTETKADPLSLESLIAWLEKQPAGKVYCFFRTGECLLAQYFQQIGVAKSVGGWTYQPSNGGVRVTIPKVLSDVASNQPHTFGAALDRARACALR